MSMLIALVYIRTFLLYDTVPFDWFFSDSNKDWDQSKGWLI